MIARSRIGCGNVVRPKSSVLKNGLDATKSTLVPSAHIARIASRLPWRLRERRPRPACTRAVAGTGALETVCVPRWALGCFPGATSPRCFSTPVQASLLWHMRRFLGKSTTRVCRSAIVPEAPAQLCTPPDAHVSRGTSDRSPHAGSPARHCRSSALPRNSSAAALADCHRARPPAVPARDAHRATQPHAHTAKQPPTPPSTPTWPSPRATTASSRACPRPCRAVGC